MIFRNALFLLGAAILITGPRHQKN